MFHLNDAETELELNVFIMDVDQILNGLVDDVECAFDDIDAHLARAGDGYWVSIDGLESLFVNRVLAGSDGDLLLALVTVKVCFEDGVDNKAWSSK